MLKRTVCTAVVMACTPLLAGAAQVTTTWNGGSGSWSTPSSWSGGVVPQNNAGTTYNVLIDGGSATPSTVFYGSYNVPSNYIVDSLTVDAGDTLTWPGDTIVNHSLTALNGMTINGSIRTSPSGGQLRVGASQAFGGFGTIELQGATIDSTSGSLTVGSALTVTGFGGTIGNKARATINQGVVWGNGSLTVAGSTITNNGTFKVSPGGLLAFDTTFQQISDLGTLVNDGGAFGIAGTLENTGRTFAINNATGNWQLSGTMRGGTLATADGRSLGIAAQTAVLDNVQLDGSVRIGYAARVTLPAGQTLTGAGTVTMADFGSNIYSAGGTFTIGPGMTIRGAGSEIPLYGIGNPARPTVNQGRVLAENGVLMVSGSALSNTGIFESATGGVLAFGGGPFTRADLGSLTQSGGAFRIAGLLDNTGQTFVVDNTTGDWQLGCGGTGVLGVGTIKGGAVNIAPGKSLLLPGFTNCSFDDVAINGTVQFDPVSPFEIYARVSLGQTLHGNAEFVFSGNNFSQSVTGAGGLEIGSDVLIRGTGGTVGDVATPLSNHGHLKAQSSIRSMNVAGSSITNSGVLESNGGQLNLVGSFTRAGLGNIVNNTAVAVAGTLNNTGEITTLDDGPGQWRVIRGGTIVGGTINLPPGEALAIGTEAARSSDITPATLDGVAVNGSIRVDGQLRVLNGLHGTNEIIGGAQGSMVAPGTLTIPPTTSIRYSVNTGTFHVGDGTQAVVNQGDINAEQLRISVEGTSIANAGRIRVTSFGDMWLATPQINNTGDLEIARGRTLSAIRNTFGFGSTTMTFGSGGTLQVELGPASTSAGKLSVSGDLDLSTLDDFLEIVVPPNTTLFPQTIVTYTGTLTGQFNHVPDGVVLDYLTPHQIRVMAVPEPAAMAMMLLPAAGGCARRRRRRSS